MEIFNFLSLIWNYYLPLAPLRLLDPNSYPQGTIIFSNGLSLLRLAGFNKRWMVYEAYNFFLAMWTQVVWFLLIWEAVQTI